MKKKQFAVISIFFILVSVLFGQSVENTQNLLSDISTNPPISVTIGGNFLVTGTFASYSGERVDQFITRIYNESKISLLTSIKDPQQFRVAQEDIENYALRGITLKSYDGTVKEIDLLRFRLTANFDYNPYLKNGDVIVFPPLDDEIKFIEISGAINVESPFRFQYVDGDKLSDAILLAGGINKEYENVENAEISRLSYNGKTEERIIISIKNDYDLKAGDRIRILGEKPNREAYKVFVRGEVPNPGVVYITKNNTKLYEVIERVGGFKQTADLNRTELIRGVNFLNLPSSNREIELMLMQRMANIDPADSASFIIDNTLRLSRGSTVIDFTKVSDSTSADANFIVKDEDVIYVPEKQELVYVFGHVIVPGYIEYKSGENYQYYINKAGGLGKFPRGEIYLIKGKTRSWIELEEESNVPIEKGDFIWVPQAPYRTFDYYLSRVGNIAQIVGSIATVIVLIVQITK